MFRFMHFEEINIAFDAHALSENFISSKIHFLSFSLGWKFSSAFTYEVISYGEDSNQRRTLRRG